MSTTETVTDKNGTGGQRPKARLSSPRAVLAERAALPVAWLALIVTLGMGSVFTGLIFFLAGSNTITGIEQAVVDVADATAVKELVDGILERHGRLDAAFANAGIALGRNPDHPDGVIDRFDLADWHRLLEVNLHGVVHTVRAAAEPMKRQRSGSIVVTASTAGLRQDPLVPYSYVVAKAGVINLVRQAALDLARWQVRVNAIAPGPFRTNIGGPGPIPPAAEAMWSSNVPLGRMGDPREIRGLALLLASGASSFMTGGVYPVDGGQLLQSPALAPLPGH